MQDGLPYSRQLQVGVVCYGFVSHSVTVAGIVEVEEEEDEGEGKGEGIVAIVAVEVIGEGADEVDGHVIVL